MKKICFIMLIFAVLTTSMQVHASSGVSATADQVLLTIQTISATPLTQFSVPVELDPQGNTPPAALNLDITFNDTVLELQGITIAEAGLSAGKELTHALVAGNTARIVIYGLNQNTIAEGVLFNLEFISTSSTGGTFPLTVTNLTLADPQAAELDGAGMDGSVVISTGGTTFADVPADFWAYEYIEALYQEGYTAGCSTAPLLYCPEQELARSHMAVFVERSHHGASFTPVDPASQIFGDVSAGHWAYDWTAEMYSDGYTAGCSTDPLLFCPDTPHTRAEAAVFLLRIKYGLAYDPDPATGIFTDVPAQGYWAARWIEAAYQDSLLPACETMPDLRFCPDEIVDRALAAYGVAIAKGIMPAPEE